MSVELIAITQYCELHAVEPDFLLALQDEGLIDLVVEGESRFIAMDQLAEMEKFRRWHDELGLNLEGIGTVHHLLGKVLRLQAENKILRDRLLVYENWQGDNA